MSLLRHIARFLGLVFLGLLALQLFSHCAWR
jgi:hypothetical protein